MTLAYIRKTYGVPATRGARVRYRREREGTIIGAKGNYLRIRFDDVKHGGNYHPTWEMEYLPTETARSGEGA